MGEGPGVRVTKQADIDRLVAQRVALNERLPEPHCRICENWTACFYGNYKGTCPLGLKGKADAAA